MSVCRRGAAPWIAAIGGSSPSPATPIAEHRRIGRGTVTRRCQWTMGKPEELSSASHHSLDVMSDCHAQQAGAVQRPSAPRRTPARRIFEPRFPRTSCGWPLRWATKLRPGLVDAGRGGDRPNPLAPMNVSRGFRARFIGYLSSMPPTSAAPSKPGDEGHRGQRQSRRGLPLSGHACVQSSIGHPDPGRAIIDRYSLDGSFFDEDRSRPLMPAAPRGPTPPGAAYSRGAPRRGSRRRTMLATIRPYAPIGARGTASQ